MFDLKGALTRAYKKTRPFVCLPFEHPSAGTLVYSLLAGMLASIGAQLLVTPSLDPNAQLSRTIALSSAFLLFVSAGAMVWIGFEIAEFKEEWAKGGRPPWGSDERRQILEKIGKVHGKKETELRLFSRLWRLWILLGISVASGSSAMYLVWTS